MEDAVHAIMMAFSVLVFVVALSVVVYMFQQATSTADNILYYADETNFYDNIELEGDQTTRIVDVDTVIPTLYRYYKENFCVKIYDASENLLQVFDVNLEGKVRNAATVTDYVATSEQKALKQIYNQNGTPLYLFEAPWIGSTDEDMKKRIDYYINGSAGYINNTYVNYENNKFYSYRKYNQTASDDDNPDNDKVYFKEEFIRYTYTGDTFVTDEGEILVEGAKPEDKIIIVYTATKEI